MTWVGPELAHKNHPKAGATSSFASGSLASPPALPPVGTRSRAIRAGTFQSVFFCFSAPVSSAPDGYGSCQPFLAVHARSRGSAPFFRTEQTEPVRLRRDLSERRRGEERLDRERAFLDLAIASLPGTFCLFDRNRKLLRWNSNLETSSGYSPEEIAKMTPSDFFVEEARPSVQEAIQRVFKEGASNIQGEVQSKHGSRRHYFFSARRILVDGKPCIIGAGIDMTERELAEKKIHEQANLLELARDAIFVRSLDEKIQYWNKGAEALYGWTADEAIGSDYSKVAYHDRDLYEEAKQILLEKGEWSGEVRKLTKARREVTVASRWTLLRDKGSGN